MYEDLFEKLVDAEVQEELARTLIKASYWYYVKADPVMSDHDNDMMLKELQRLEGRKGVNSKSPSQMVYGDLKSQYPAWAKEDRDLNNLGRETDPTVYGTPEEPEEITTTVEETWDYTFKYEHNQLWNNPIVDKEGKPLIWQKNRTKLQGHKLRVFNNYQASWAERNGAVPVLENKDMRKD